MRMRIHMHMHICVCVYVYVYVHVYACKNVKGYCMYMTIVTVDQQDKLMLPRSPTHQCE